MTPKPEPTTELSVTDVLWIKDFDKHQIMDLIEAEIPRWSDDTAPRHALSVLWGKVRDL